MPKLNYSKINDVMQSKFGWVFIVEGMGNFPADMLRYDQCFPVIEKEANRLSDGDFHGKTRFTLKSHRQYLTPKRWQSFLWNIIEAYPLNKDGMRQSEQGIFNGQFL